MKKTIVPFRKINESRGAARAEALKQRFKNASKQIKSSPKNPITRLLKRGQ